MAVRAAVAITIGSAVLAGCTLLVSFDVPDDAAATDTDSAAPPPSGTDAQPADSAVVPTPVDAASTVQPECKKPAPIIGFCNDEGFLCGRSFNNYPGDKQNDLLKCEFDTFAVVTKCVATCPGGCVLVDKFDDQCDPCAGRADGTYCGHDVGWTKRNENVAVRCKSGKVASTDGCSGKKCQNSCTGADKPSCCGP